MIAAARQKPVKPYPAYPLFAHGNGMWAKKIRGQVRYFGKWSDPQAALDKFLAQKDALYAGREPLPVGTDDLLVRDLCNHYLAHKKALVETGELAERTFHEYLSACKRLARVVGATTAVDHLVREDFTRLRADMSKTWGPVRVLNEIRRVRMVFSFGVAQNLIAHAPSYGDGMKRPSAKILRRNRSEKGIRMFTPDQLRLILDSAGLTLRAMVLLGINCGYGNTDIGQMERRRIDLKTGWEDYPRPKTGVPRRCPLWPETVAALRKVLRRRDRRLKEEGEKGRKGEEEKQTPPATTPAVAVGTATPDPASGVPTSDSPLPAPRSLPKAFRNLVFLTAAGRPWRAKTGNPISTEFGRLVRRLGIHRPGLGFYALRHTFQTVGGGTKDEPAISAIMGHIAKASDMAAQYREQIDDARLREVTDHVHAWLFGAGSGEQGAGSKTK